MLAGNGLAKYADVFARALGDGAALAPRSWWAPRGEGLLGAFASSIVDGSVVGGEPGIVLPIYTRLSDAEEAESARAGLASPATPDTGVKGPRPGGGTSPAGPESAGLVS